MTHGRLYGARWTSAAMQSGVDFEADPMELEVRVEAAAFYLACLRRGLLDEATEFAEWYLDTFDHDLET